MSDIIYKFIYWVARVHDWILTLNDTGQYYFNDKQLHFIVVGIFGMLLIFIVYPIFKLLAKYDHTMVIAWIYVFTVILVVTFAIEIGQWYFGTGNPETADITYGIVGFLVMFLFFAIIRGLYHAIAGMFRSDDAKH